MSANATVGLILPARYLDPTAGAYLIAVMVSTALWAANCVQVYHYFTFYVKDEMWIKLMVGFMSLFDTAHQAVLVASIYIYAVTWWGYPLTVETLFPITMAVIPMTYAMDFLVQMFFIFRVWRFSRRNVWITTLLMGLATASFATLLVYFAKLQRNPNLTGTIDLSSFANVFTSLSAACDLLIAFTLISLLRRSRGSHSRSNTIIDRLIRGTMCTGLLTSLWGVCLLATMAKFPTKEIYVFFFTNIGKLYVNSMCATLNARDAVKSPTSQTSWVSLVG